ncbi:hypothetical protein PMAYCL1PPCAC_02080 [Pristionchus mayeri]|uniref:Uncharacterized protein n=1 Tax=Pristionchus mayeri TaxID=1317129 RepID=A0AAN4Z611_9BILA|nr:hypothetical protein PMAYCL1PPCAC_02080 [Pristionchus mayeri]
MGGQSVGLVDGSSPGSSLLGCFQHLILQLLHDFQSSVRVNRVQFEDGHPVGEDRVRLPVIVPHTRPVPRGHALASVQPDLGLHEGDDSGESHEEQDPANLDVEGPHLVRVSHSTKQETERSVSPLRGLAQIEGLVSAPIASVSVETSLCGLRYLSFGCLGERSAMHDRRATKAQSDRRSGSLGQKERHS